MFIRIKRSKNSPKCSVQIVESKREGGKVKQKIVKHMGTAYEGEELEKLKALAESVKRSLEEAGQLPLFSEGGSTQERDLARSEGCERECFDVNLLDVEEEKRIVRGIHDIYGKLYDALGFSRIIPNPSRNRRSIEALKEIVLARIANPDSKRASRLHLEENFGVELDLNLIYRMMDKITDERIAKLNTLVFEKSKGLFNEKIDVIYFDATTLYFESFEEDSFRKNGYSKDGKFNQPQVVLALMVTKEGLPIGYKAFAGDTFDGHTLIPTLEEIKAHYALDKVVYVADAGMFNQNNLQELATLQEHGISYIVGARIKNLPKRLQAQILNLDNYRSLDDNTQVATFDYQGKRLVVSYSKKRAKKERHERQKGIERLRQRLEKNGSIKSQLSNQGYRKYLRIKSNHNSCDASIVLDEAKIEEDTRWDGLKGVVTNNPELDETELLHQYANLWQIEESFRITKHDLKIRPIYHFKEQRVKAHLAIAFMAYTLVRHLEYRVKLQYKKLSLERIRSVLMGVQESILHDTRQNRRFAMPSAIAPDAEKIYKLMGVKHSKKPRII